MSLILLKNKIIQKSNKTKNVKKHHLQLVSIAIRPPPTPTPPQPTPHPPCHVILL